MNQGLVEIEEDGSLFLQGHWREGFVENERPADGGGDFEIRRSTCRFQFLGFGENLVASVAVGTADSSQLGEDLDESAMAGEDGLVNGGDESGGGPDFGFLHRRSSPVTAAVVPAVLNAFGWGFLRDLGHHFKVGTEREREREMGF